MPTLSRFFGIVISMYWDDHNPPHFHARYAENETEIGILSLEILAGHLPRRALSLVLEWASQHRQELWANWERVHSEQPITPIAPLE